MTKQTVNWQPGNYRETRLGSARLLSTHWTVLKYVAELGVPMEVEVNTSRSAVMQNDKANGGKPMVMRKELDRLRDLSDVVLLKRLENGVGNGEIPNQLTCCCWLASSGLRSGYVAESAYCQ